MSRISATLSATLAVALLLVSSGCGALYDEKMAWPDSQLTAVREPETLHLADEEGDPVEFRERPRVVVPTTALRWPLFPNALTSHFGIRQDPFKPKLLRFHKGLDMSAHRGATVYATLAGVVVSEGNAGGHGHRVVLDHGAGVRSSYSHMQMAFVTAGMRVAEGEPLGLVGETGRSTGPHLHFEISMDGEPIDPLPLLGGRMPFDYEQRDPSVPPKLPVPLGAQAAHVLR